MESLICDDVKAMGESAAKMGAQLIREAIQNRGEANIIVATGASQFEVLENLVSAEGIDWNKVVGFHLDEYIGLPISHPASFRRYLKERLVDRVPLREFHYVNGEVDPDAECRRLGETIGRHPTDVAFIGIGENGHLAFNDPPADLETTEPYIVVNLDEACRRQQLGEGWFPRLEDVPARAISMSMRQILSSTTIICSVPDRRKAEAVKGTLEGPVGPELPASVLREHPRAFLYLDREAASLLTSPPE